MRKILRATALCQFVVYSMILASPFTDSHNTYYDSRKFFLSVLNVLIFPGIFSPFSQLGPFQVISGIHGNRLYAVQKLAVPSSVYCAAVTN